MLYLAKAWYIVSALRKNKIKKSSLFGSTLKINAAINHFFNKFQLSKYVPSGLLIQITILAYIRLMSLVANRFGRVEFQILNFIDLFWFLQLRLPVENNNKYSKFEIQNSKFERQHRWATKGISNVKTKCEIFFSNFRIS